jgi:hypothetical protein
MNAIGCSSFWQPSAFTEKSSGIEASARDNSGRDDSQYCLHRVFSKNERLRGQAVNRPTVVPLLPYRCTFELPLQGFDGDGSLPSLDLV